MAALVDLSDVVNRCTGGNNGTPQSIFMFKDARIGASAAGVTVAGFWNTLWEYNGTVPGGNIPTTVLAPDNTTQGALGQASPGGGRTQYLLGAHGIANQGGTILLYDRLLQIGGLSGTVTTAQTVGGAITRNTGGVGNQIWVEINTLIGVTGTTITAAYTNQAGAAKTTQATAIGNTNLREVQRMIPLPLASGDTGVQSVTSATLAGTTGTAGDFGVVLMRPILSLPIVQAGIGVTRNLLTEIPGVQTIESASCLAFAFMANSAAAPQIFVQTLFIEA